MHRTLRLGWIVVALSVAGCMPFKFYPLPVSAGEARATFAPLATAASNLGYKYWQWPDSLSFEPDGKTRITYTFDVSGNYVMYVLLKDKNIAGGLDAAFVAGKAKGDDLWNRAMALRPPPAPAQIVVPAPQPAIQININ